jgi:Cys-rich repeat protein
MRNLGLLVGFVLVAMVAGCSSSAADNSCTVNTDCEQAFVCVGSTCEQVECSSTADCSGDGAFCAAEGVDPDQADKKFCSPIQCKSDSDCGDGMVCNKYKQCEGGTASDVPEGETTGDPDVVDQDNKVEPDNGVVTKSKACSACSSDKDCGDMKCYPLGGGTFCFGDCAEHTDCPTGWMCYALSNQGKQCIPMAFNCEGECLAAGCPAGKMCDQESGTCAAGGDACGQCQQDWDCMEGLRCYTQGKYCAPTCGTGTCEQGSSCQEVNNIPMKLCVSNSPACCYGESCAGTECSGVTPYACGDKCCECLQDSHCGQGEKCTNNTCTAGQCSGATPYFCNGACQECCNNGQCAAKGPEYVCKNNKCTSEALPEECDYCEPPFPACTQINGIWSCVQCVSDADCPGSTCDLTLYSCGGGGTTPGTACGVCTQDADCVSSSGTALTCDGASGCCYDPAGWCDGVESFCNSLENSTCKGLMDMLGGGGIPGGGIPGMPTGAAFGLCTCSEPLDMMTLMMCIMGGCPAGGCWGAAVCVDPSILTSLLGGGGTPAPSGEGFCINLQSLLGGLF